MWKCVIPCHKHQPGKSLHNKGLKIRECVSSLWEAQREILVEMSFFFFIKTYERSFIGPLKKEGM